MQAVVNDPKLVAYCGLYCGACGKYRSGKCPGCAANEKATWCAVRTCCIEHDYQNCADCAQFADVAECKAYNSFIAKLFGFIFRSDRKACIYRIKEIGVERFAAEMVGQSRPSIKR